MILESKSFPLYFFLFNNDFNLLLSSLWWWLKYLYLFWYSLTILINVWVFNLLGWIRVEFCGLIYFIYLRSLCVRWVWLSSLLTSAPRVPSVRPSQLPTTPTSVEYVVPVRVCTYRNISLCKSLLEEDICTISDKSTVSCVVHIGS